MSLLSSMLFKSSARILGSVCNSQAIFSVPVREYKIKDIKVPKPGQGQCFRRIVHYPETYTTKPLKITKLGGRDPITGRKVVEGIGGGRPQTYLWVDFVRKGPKEDPPLVEKVLQILECTCRTSFVALVASGNHMRYILATENMKPGDLIRTSGHIPRIAVRPNEGDAYPLGALPLGIQVHNIERTPGAGGRLVHAAGTAATILRRIGENIIIQLPSKHEICVNQECMVTVGCLSNVKHSETHIGSAQRMRFLGNRPRSGLWHRKEGRHGKKIRGPPPIKNYTLGPAQPAPEVLTLTAKPNVRIAGS